MKLRKVKHLINNEGEAKGYDIYVKVGNEEYFSWWSSPPKERLICHLEYLRERYPIITTQKRLEKFKELWVEMWKEASTPKVKCVKGFAVEKYDYNGSPIPNKYYTINEGEIWDIDKESNKFLGGEIRLTKDVKRGCSWMELSKETFEENFVIIDE